MNSFADSKTEALAKIIRTEFGKVQKKVLVVGCGRGIEAAVIVEELGADVVGIDLISEFDSSASKVATLCVGDATKIDFEDESFDFVYSFHALEHIPEYKVALREMRRVLKPNGGFLIGTPNRSRLIGYLGGRGATFFQKIHWNFLDWTAKITGRFRNECGAHAGYTSEELRSELTAVFTVVNDVTSAYYFLVYGSYRPLVSLIYRLGISRWLLPSIYFCGSRG